MEDETQEIGLSFSDYFDKSLLEKTPEPVVAVTQPIATEGETAVAQVAEQQVAQPDVTPAPVVSPAQVDPLAILRNKGFNVDESADPAELYGHIADQLQAGLMAQREQERLRREVEQLKASLTQPTQQSAPPIQSAPVVKPEPEVTKPRAAGRLKSAQAPPEESWLYVEEGEDGKYVPRAEYGPAAVEHAKVINNFLDVKRHNAEAILVDPRVAFDEYKDELLESLKKQAHEAAAQEFNSWRESITKQEQEQLAAKQAAAERASEEEFHNSNKSRIFHLDLYGQPKRLFDGGPTSTTQLGTVFFTELEELRSQLPQASDVYLMKQAMKTAELRMQLLERQALPAAPAQTAEELKEKFLGQRQPVAVQPNASPAVAQPEDFDDFANMSFASAMRRDPDNRNNPIFRTSV
jgi:hypothetical protein